MSARVVVFTDLDDTLFQTGRKLKEADKALARQVSHATNGHHSFMTRAQSALFDWIDPARAIPVTARGTEAFSRVHLTFGEAAIVANGAVIIDASGKPDPEWQARIQTALASSRAALDALPDLAVREARRLGAGVRTWLVEEPRCGGVYAVVKAEPGTPEAVLAEIAPALQANVDDRWRVHINGNNLALIPPGISKAAATAFLLTRLRGEGPVLAIGVGDSHSDLDFMRLCDLWMTPTGSQLDQVVAEYPS